MFINMPPLRCSYWSRQEFRLVDDTRFGCSPYNLMTPEQAALLFAQREVDDETDPPCGMCATCVDLHFTCVSPHG